jgi:hypothetical protein
MATLFKEVSYNLQTLIQNIDMGIIGLPDIQRPFVWKDTKVRDLFDSMYKGYPVGYLLFWANGHEDAHKTIGADKKQKTPSILIVDGQQRLTSLYAVIKGMDIIRDNFKKEKIVISFKPLEEKFEIPDAATLRSPEYIHNITKLWDSNLDMFDFVNNFINKLRETREITPEDKRKIQNAITQLKSLEAYPFSSLELNASIEEEQVADVFVRINSEGKKLNMADFILTLMSVFWDEGRRDLENFCGLARIPAKDVPSPFNYIIEPDPDQMLRAAVGLGFRRARLQYVYSILRGKDLETGKFSTERRDAQFEILKQSQQNILDIQNWHEFLKALKLAGYVKADYISSKLTVIFAYTLFLIGRVDFKVDLHDLKNLIARWFYMITLTGRYTGSAETQMEMDLAKIRNISTALEFTDALNEIIETTLTNDFWNINLPSDLAKSSSFSKSLFAYYAALKIVRANGLFSKLLVGDLLQEGMRSKKSALERHHLFPKEYLKKLGIAEQTDINQIANYALVEWGDNIKISDTAPADYLPVYKARFTDEQYRKMCYWHALPEEWETLEYKDFLVKRRQLMAAVIKDAFDILENKVVAIT